MESTIRAFANRAVAAVQGVEADVEKVTLTFGISLGGEIGVPFVTSGKAESSLTVGIECRIGGQDGAKRQGRGRR